VVLAEFFIWFNTFTFTFHDNGDGPTFVSAETMLIQLEGSKQFCLPRVIHVHTQTEGYLRGIDKKSFSTTNLNALPSSVPNPPPFRSCSAPNEGAVNWLNFYMLRKPFSVLSPHARTPRGVSSQGWVPPHPEFAPFYSELNPSYLHFHNNSLQTPLCLCRS